MSQTEVETSGTKMTGILVEELNTLLKKNKEKFFALPRDVLEQLFNSIGLDDVNSYYNICMQDLNRCTPHMIECFYRVYGYPKSSIKDGEEKPASDDPPASSRSGISQPTLTKKRSPASVCSVKRKTKNNKRSKKLTDDLINRLDMWKNNKDMVNTVLNYCDVEGSWKIITTDKSIVDLMDEKLVSRLFTQSSPYNKLPLQNQDGQKLLFCLTNMRQEYMKRFVMTSLVSYIYRCTNEFQFYDTDYGESKAVIPELGLFEPDKESCNQNRVGKPGPRHPGEQPDTSDNKAVLNSGVGTCSDKRVDSKAVLNSGVGTCSDKRVMSNGDKIGYEDMKKMNIHVKKLITTFLNEYFEFNPDIHVANSYKPFKDSTGKLLDETKTALPKDVHVPPFDTFKRWSIYEDVNYDKLRDLTDNIYNEKSSTEYAIAPLKVVNSEREETEFREKYESDLTTSILSANMWAWTYVDNRKENRDKIRYTGKQMDFVNEMTKQHQTDEKHYKSMLEKRVKSMKKKDVKKHGEFSDKLKDYANKSGSEFGKLGIQQFKDGDKPADNLVTDIDGVQLDPTEDDCPDNAKEVNVIKFTSDVASETTIAEAAKFFVESTDDVDSVNVDKA